MYEVNREDLVPKNLFAGDFPVVTGVEKVKAGTPVGEHTLVALKSTGLEAASASNLADLHGITATAAEGGKGEKFTRYIQGLFELDRWR